jgi:hypothetical protein
VLDRLSVRFRDGRTWSAEDVQADRHLRIRPGRGAPEVLPTGVARKQAGRDEEEGR